MPRKITLSRREQSAMSRRLRRAHFDAPTILEEFDFHAKPQAARRTDPQPGHAALAARRRPDLAHELILGGVAGC